MTGLDGIVGAGSGHRGTLREGCSHGRTPRDFLYGTRLPRYSTVYWTRLQRCLTAMCGQVPYVARACFEGSGRHGHSAVLDA